MHNIWWIVELGVAVGYGDDVGEWAVWTYHLSAPANSTSETLYDRAKEMYLAERNATGEDTSIEHMWMHFYEKSENQDD